MSLTKTTARHARTSAPSAAAIGARLRAQRSALGHSLTDAAKQTRVKESYLSALERGRVEELPTGGYALGYLRSYADWLGLDAAVLVNDYKLAVNPKARIKTRDRYHFVEKTKARLPRGSVPALGVLGAVIMLGTWYGVQTDSFAAPTPVETPNPSTMVTEDSLSIPEDVILLRATSPSWVRVEDAKGKVLVNRVFVTGESWQIKTGKPFALTLRDGGAVDLYVGENRIGPVGQAGQPLSDYPINIR